MEERNRCMASVDGSRSVLGVSDEADTHICGPCQRKAEYCCEDCLEYLCTPCKDYHKKLHVTKSHIIVSAGQASVNTTIRGRPSTVIYCRCNKQQEVQYYCEDHQEILCDLCKETKHYKCQTSTIQIKSSAYSSSKLDSVASKLNGIKDAYAQLNKERNDESKRLERMKDDCRKTIEKFRKEIDSFLDKLENNMLKQVELFETEGQKRISQHISTLTANMKLLESDLKLVEDAKNDGRKETMFAAGEQVSKDVQGYVDRLGDIENEAKETEIIFEKNAKLVQLLTEIDSLGSVKRSSARKNQTSRRKTLLDGKIQSQKQVNIMMSDDSSRAWITGIAVMPTGEAVLCDYYNVKLKLLDSSDAITTSLKLNNQPYDASAVDDKTVIITLPGSNQLQYIQVFPQLAQGRVLKLEKKCWGVHVTCGKLFTTCHNNLRQGEVRILDLDGNLLGVNRDGSFLFTLPYHITVGPSGQKLFVSDFGKNTVTCMTMDNRAIYQYRDDEMKVPKGVYCDSGDNILVCGESSNNIQLITADGKKHGTLASSKDGLVRPITSLSYRQSDDTLIVGMLDTKISLLKLGK